MTTSRIRVLVIEDDPPIRKFLRSSLSTQSYDLIECDTASQGIALAASHNPDLVLLDLGLPDLDGLEVIRKIREWSAMPIIVVSARGQERDKVAALDLGADDYLTKPFGLAELLARIRASLRRRATSKHGLAESSVQIEDVLVDFDKHCVTRGGEEVHLTPLEFKLLEVLLRNRGKVITHRQLLHDVWGPSHSDQTHYLRIYILQLRRKLEHDPARPRWILSEPGVGYRIRDDGSILA